MKEEKEQTGMIPWFTRNNIAANFLMLSIMFMGIASIFDLRKEAFPSIEPNSISISVSYESGDPKQSEEGVTLKIEDALESVDGIKRITSTSTSSGSSIFIEKQSGYDLSQLVDDVEDEIDTINNFPSDADTPIVTEAKRSDHAVYVQLFGEGDREKFQTLGNDLKRDLLKKSAISQVKMMYESDPFIAIEIDKTTLKSYGLTLAMVDDIINNESKVALTTSLRNGDKTVKIKGMEQLYTVEQFGEIPVITDDTGATVRLKDIATIKKDFDEDDFVINRFNRQSGITLQLTMGDNNDIMKISDAANLVVSEWKSEGKLPSNINIETWKDSSETIETRLSLLSKNAITGIILVFIILAIFLNLQVAFWVAAGIPFIFLGTLYFMTGTFADLTINQITTFGFIMALGIVVDDAVVVGESIYDTRKKDGDTVENTIKGVMKVAVPTIFGVLTTVVSFIALSKIEGNLGQIFAQFGMVVTICLILSLVESKFILPSHLSHINTTKDKGKVGKYDIIGKIQKFADHGLNKFRDKLYTPFVDVCLKTKTLTFMIFLSVILFVGSLPFNGGIRISFFPNIPGDEVKAELSMLDDASYNQTAKNLLFLEEQAYITDEELNNKYKGEKETEITSVSITSNSDISGSLSVVFKDEPSYTAAEFASTLAIKTADLEGTQKLKIRSTREMVDNFNIELKSTSIDAVRNSGQEVRKYLENIEGVSAIEDNLTKVVSQYKVELTDQGRTLGFTPFSLSSQLINIFGGGSVQKFQDSTDEVTVSVRYPKEDRQTLSNLLEANVVSPSGDFIPVTSVATIVSTYQESTLTRIDNQKAIFIKASVDKDIISSNELVLKVTDNVLAQLEIKYPSLNAKFSGEQEEQEESVNSMKFVAIAALIAIYALLAIPLQSYIQPILIMTSIPFGIVGALLGHWITGLEFSILSLFGILALSGVVVNDSLLLVTRFNELRAKTKLNVHDAVIEAATSRLRAVLLTSVTTFAGLIPLLSETSRSSQFLKPAAASLGYGILFATVITLILIPILLIMHENAKVYIANFKKKIMP